MYMLPVKLEYQKNATKYDLCDFPSSPSWLLAAQAGQASRPLAAKKEYSLETSFIKIRFTMDIGLPAC